MIPETRQITDIKIHTYQGVRGTDYTNYIHALNQQKYEQLTLGIIIWLKPHMTKGKSWGFTSFSTASAQTGIQNLY